MIEKLSQIQKETLELLRSTTGVERDYLWRIIKGEALDFDEIDKQKLDSCIQEPEDRLKQDIARDKEICPMVKCVWRQSDGKCNNNGLGNLLDTCKKENYKLYEERKS